jgi:peptide/nickel transport system permease protein
MAATARSIEATIAGPATGYWLGAWQGLLRNRGAVAGAVLLVLIALMGIFAPALAPYDPDLQARDEVPLLPPSAAHPLGTDSLARDNLSRVIWGARVSLPVGIVSVGIAALFGVLLGLIAGYYGGWADMLISRVIEVMLAFPGIMLALAIIQVLGPGLNNVMIAVGIGAIPGYTRVVRGSVLAVREAVYVEAARVLGCPDRRILLRHVLPNVVAPIIVLSTLGLAGAILAAASLSFLGLGSQPPTAEWGAMLSRGRDFLRTAPWVTLFPGLAILLTVLAVNLLGDGLRDALDPRLRSR